MIRPLLQEEPAMRSSKTLREPGEPVQKKFDLDAWPRVEEISSSSLALEL